MAKQHIRTFAGASWRIGRFVAVLCVIAMPTAGLAMNTDATPSERAACTPDVFRLCSAEIPSVDRIVACLVAKRAHLSTACKAVFAKRQKAARSAENTP